MSLCVHAPQDSTEGVSMGADGCRENYLQDKLVAAAQEHSGAPAGVLYARHLHHLSLANLPAYQAFSQCSCEAPSRRIR